MLAIIVTNVITSRRPESVMVQTSLDTIISLYLDLRIRRERDMT